MKRMLIFGLGYCGRVLAETLATRGWQVESTGRAGTLDFTEAAAALERAEAVLSTVPPGAGMGESDPVLARYGAALQGRWLGYLSSTGVYGDAQGAWVDESAPLRGRRPERIAADRAWLARGARVFRLPGIYGPGRSAFDRLRHRVELPGHVFSRIHVDDIARAVLAALESSAPPGAYNLADDLPASQQAVIAEACRLIGVAPPPLVPPEALSPQTRAFYAENRRIANGKARRVLGWQPLYPTYREGLAALRPVSAISSPASASNDPATASGVQR